MSKEEHDIIPIRDATITIEGIAWDGGNLYFKGHAGLIGDMYDARVSMYQDDIRLMADNKPLKIVYGEKSYRLVLDVPLLPIESGDRRRYELKYGDRE
jgi:hypothetical protein